MSEVEDLHREVYGLQEMIAAILYTVGEPVEVSKETLSKLNTRMRINVEDDIQREMFVFKLVNDEQQ